MTNINNIKFEFYNPNTDSISDLILKIKKIHSKVLSITDKNKPKIKIKTEKYFDILKKDYLEKDYKIEELFEGVVRWHSPNTMYNVTPPPLLSCIAIQCISSLYNPNLAWDIASGKLAYTEQATIKYISDLVNWNWKKSGGCFVFGGKGTNLYAIYTGLKECIPNYNKKGITKDVFVLSTKACHPCHVSVCKWLGLGEDNCIRINTLKNNTIDLNEFEITLDKLLSKNKKVAAIMLSGGTTMDLDIDPIEKVIEIRNKLILKYKLTYKPHVHFDTVIGWAWLFFKNYDFKRNKLKISSKSIKQIKETLNKLKYINLADSIGVDFHKTGFSPYSSSLFLIKNKKLIYDNFDNFVDYSEYVPFKYTLENSRPAQSAIMAYIALKTLKPIGFQKIIGHLTDMKNDLVQKIETSKKFIVLNKYSHGLSVVFIPKLNDTENKLINNYIDSYYYRIFKENKYFIDVIPAYTTGSSEFNHKCLKAYIMSPFSTEKTNTDFVNYMINIKETKNIKNTKINENHPLKC